LKERAMALRIKTSDPQGLLTRIKKVIDQGHVRTWAYDKDGDFTHTPQQFVRQAWLRPAIEPEELRLHIIRNTSIAPTRAIYGIYHGRFIEELLTHFFASFDPAWPTTSPMAGDDYPV
jgi:hypothetical protein